MKYRCVTSFVANGCWSVRRKCKCWSSVELKKPKTILLYIVCILVLCSITFVYTIYIYISRSTNWTMLFLGTYLNRGRLRPWNAQCMFDLYCYCCCGIGTHAMSPYSRNTGSTFFYFFSTVMIKVMSISLITIKSIIFCFENHKCLREFPPQFLIRTNFDYIYLDRWL